MSPIQYIRQFAPFAAKNNVVMVFPESIICWDNGWTKESFGVDVPGVTDNYYSRAGI